MKVIVIGCTHAGTAAISNLKKNHNDTYMGTQGTSEIKIYGWNIAATGLTEGNAKAIGLQIETSMLIDNYRPEFMPDYEAVHLKVVYESVFPKDFGNPNSVQG